MKAIKPQIVALLIFWSFFSIGWSQELGINIDDYRMVSGQIVDPRTGECVKEKFGICVFNFQMHGRFLINALSVTKGEIPFDAKTSVVTDENGYFSALFPIGNYNVSIYPIKQSSQYCHEPLFEGNIEKYSKNYDFRISVNKDKNTYFIRKATLGGNVKVLLVDPSGNPIDPRIDFSIKPVIKISLSCGVNYGSQDIAFESGELTVSSLFPETYSMITSIYGFGLSEIKSTNIIVKASETTEVRLTLDPHDNSGIEGYVYDKNGFPLKGEYVGFQAENNKLFCLNIFTDSNGYFRMTGMPEGRYIIYLAGEHLLESPVFVEVRKGVLINIKLYSKFNAN